MDMLDAVLARCLALHPKLIDLSLGRIERLLARMDHPERRLPPVIHVAGTNGKGSTVAFMRAILEEAGLRVHVYTSPHLVRFHERIRLGAPGGGRFVPDERLAAALERCLALNAGDPITFFEITTAAAFDLFSATPADVLLLEVGLGGRLDTTNVVARPACAVVTPVGRDHVEFLGETLAEIAREKAGIFKRGCPAVIAPQDHPEADAALVLAAERVGVKPLLVGGQDFTAWAERGRLVYQDEGGLLDLPLPRLAGRHQIVNAGTAVAALRAAGFGALESSVFERGIAGADWPGRLQRLTRGRLGQYAPEGADLWLDGGHNRDGARVVAAAMADLEERSPAPLVLLLAMLAKKDAAGFLAEFRGLAREVVAVPMTSETPQRPPGEIVALAEEAGFRARASSSLEEALSGLSRSAFERAPRVLICGSLYLAGEVLDRNGTPPR
ncbi:folylpolyglutamate synthase/dihydrofolate synthase family protein [Enterovirga sp.]|uniref:bifunctional folylpolyglutamate synthase/dihydrofolate synthase n=1 Tax=Enterovirga sp. TaxID=2026350 RepID=UPI002B94911A|nr:folylpolyglutamate synthase/dihydrofolate synthase family protein [Enterovirga sp.]HMO31032.1 folylpolyglutamate synthase/dihydrofolate synthase family protein [Enterovirga sp.]